MLRYLRGCPHTATTVSWVGEVRRLHVLRPLSLSLCLSPPLRPSSSPSPSPSSGWSRPRPGGARLLTSSSPADDSAAAGEGAKFDREIDAVAQELQKVALEISDTNSKISRVEQQAEHAAAQVMAKAEPGIEYWIYEKKVLDGKDQDLRDKEKQLRDKESKLLDKEKDLKAEKSKWMDAQSRKDEAKAPEVDCSQKGWQIKLMDLIQKHSPDTAAVEQRFTRPYSIAAIKMDTVGREGSLGALLSLWGRKVVRFGTEYREPVPAMGDPPGAGKSHLISIAAGRGRWIERDGQWMREDDAEFEAAMETLLPEEQHAIRNAVGVTITFNHATTLNKTELEDRDKAVAQRLLHSHFHRGEWAEFQDFLDEGVSGLNVLRVFKLILSDVDAKFPGENRFLIVAVDELIRLAGDVHIGKKGREACALALGTLAPLYQHPRVMFVVTSLSSVVLPQTSSARQINYFDVPLLDAAAVKQLVKNEGNDVKDVLESRNFQCIIDEAGGLPRLLWGVIDGARSGKVNEKSPLSEIRTLSLEKAEMNQRWEDGDLRRCALLLSLYGETFLRSVDTSELWKKVISTGYAYPDSSGGGHGIIPPAILMHWNTDKFHPIPVLKFVERFINNDHILHNVTQGRYFEKQMASAWMLQSMFFTMLAEEGTLPSVPQFKVSSRISVKSLLRPQADKSRFPETVLSAVLDYTKVKDDLKNVTQPEPELSMNDLDPAQHLVEYGRVFMAAEANNAGFDSAARLPLSDGSDLVMLFESKRTGNRLSSRVVADKFAKIFSFSQDGQDVQRDRLIPYFNSKRLVFVVGGWCDLAENLEDRERRDCTDAVVEECVKELTRCGVSGLMVDEEKVRSALLFIGKEDMRLLLGASLLRLATFQS